MKKFRFSIFGDGASFKVFHRTSKYYQLDVLVVRLQHYRETPFYFFFYPECLLSSKMIYFYLMRRE
jgi:hypothetical protein